MIITCPSCSAKFAVKAESIGPAGRKVRCAKCKHDWFQDPPPIEDLAAAGILPSEPQAAAPVPEGSNLPATIPGESAPLYMKLAFSCAILLLVFTLSITKSQNFLPKLGWYYSMLGVHDDSGIALYNVSAEKSGEGNKKELLVKGRIVNESKSDKAIPNLKIILMDKKNKQLRVVTLDSHDTALAPGEGIDFENRIQKLPEDIATVVMDIGNVVNLASR